MGCPSLHGRRGVAFPVQAPYRDALGIIGTVEIGFHFRHKPTNDGDRPKWSYCPNGIAALPFVIGAGFVPFARTVVVTEGQWDAITLAAAAGWLASDAAWPERVALFATRGAAAWKSLVDLWGSYWPKDARFILFADADEAGATWKAPGGFRETLLTRGHRVRLVRSNESGAKDLNDLHRAQPLTPETIAEWITLKAKTP
jgi:hypothetical protein